MRRIERGLGGAVLASAWRGGERRSHKREAVRSRPGLVSPSVPTPVWGRDELRAGEMWNSNSVVAWILSRAGLDITDVHPPAGGRAPGWNAGRTVAQVSRDCVLVGRRRAVV